MWFRLQLFPNNTKFVMILITPDAQVYIRILELAKFVGKSTYRFTKNCRGKCHLRDVIPPIIPCTLEKTVIMNIKDAMQQLDEFGPMGRRLSERIQFVLTRECVSKSGTFSHRKVNPNNAYHVSLDQNGEPMPVVMARLVTKAKEIYSTLERFWKTSKETTVRREGHSSHPRHKMGGLFDATCGKDPSYTSSQLARRRRRHRALPQLDCIVVIYRSTGGGRQDGKYFPRES